MPSKGLYSLTQTDKLLAKDVSKQKITQEDADAAKGLITTSTNMEDLSQIDFVIEAVPVWYQRHFTREASSD